MYVQPVLPLDHTVPLPPTRLLQLQKHCEPEIPLEGSAQVLSA